MESGSWIQDIRKKLAEAGVGLGDFWGGLAATLVALPSAIAFGVVIYSTLGPEYVAQGAVAGILGAVALGIIAPLVGGSPRLISAPCAPAAAVMAALAAEILSGAPAGAAPAPERIIFLMVLVGLLSAGFQFLYGAAGAGRLIKFIPYPVVTGYLSGVALLIFLGQLPNFFGTPKGMGLWTLLTSPAFWKWPGVVVGIVTTVVMVLAPRVTRAVPAPILGLAAGVSAYFGIGWWHPELLTLSGNPLVIGAIGGSGASPFAAIAERWASIGGFHVEDFKAILMPALTLSVLLSIDTLKTCVVVDALTRSRHQSNRVLVGQGIGNFISAALGGLPGAGTMGATIININSGGLTRLSGFLEGAFVLASFYFLSRFIAWIPLAALAAVLIVAAYRMFDFHNFRLLRQWSTALDFVVVAAVIVVAVKIDLIAAAGTGLFLAILLFIRDQVRGSVIRRKTTGDKMSSKQRRLPEETAVLEKKGAGTAVVELQGNLFFGTTDQMFTELEPELKLRKYLILDMRRVQSVDFTAVHMFQQIEGQMAERKGLLILSDLPPNLPTGQDLKVYFDQLGLSGSASGASIFDTLDDALEWTEDRLLEEEQMLQTEEQAPLGLGEIDLLRESDEEFLSALRPFIKELSFSAGQKIFAIGDIGDEIFFVRKGIVKIQIPLERGKAHPLVAFGRGDFFGDMAFLDKGVRSADAVADADVELYTLSRSRFNELARAHPDLGSRIFARLARALAIRLRRTDAELRAMHDS